MKKQIIKRNNVNVRGRGETPMLFAHDAQPGEGTMVRILLPLKQ